jgi:glutaconate CoA-transferase subunit A
LIPSPGSIAPDMLIGAGCVATTACIFISFEQWGLAPNFRRAAESGTIKVQEMDGPGIAGGLRAGACDLPYGLIPDMQTDLPRVNPERRMLAVPAVQPDLLLLHGQQADEMANVQLFGGAFFDPLLAQASKRVVVSVDRIVDNATIRKAPRLTKLPAALVDAVVEAPFGAHPSSSAATYDLDEVHITEYVRASADPAAFDAYLQRFVRGPADHADYLMQIGAAHLERLRKDAVIA